MKPRPTSTQKLVVQVYKVAVKFSEIVRFASDTRKTIEAISPFVRLVGGASDEIPPVNLGRPGKS